MYSNRQVITRAARHRANRSFPAFLWTHVVYSCIVNGSWHNRRGCVNISSPTVLYPFTKSIKLIPQVWGLRSWYIHKQFCRLHKLRARGSLRNQTSKTIAPTVQRPSIDLNYALRCGSKLCFLNWRIVDCVSPFRQELSPSPGWYLGRGIVSYFSFSSLVQDNLSQHCTIQISLFFP